MKNQELARVFERIADALEIRGETGFRVLAYRNAARTLNDLAADVAELDTAGELEEVPGIGKGIARKVHEYLATGHMQKYDEAVAGLPPGLFDLLKIQGVGPKTVKSLYEKLGVTDAEGLKKAIANGTFTALPGMGDKRASNILEGIRTGEVTGERMYLDEAFELAGVVIAHLKLNPNVRQLACGGSLRRGAETVGDIDILATGRKSEEIIRHFTNHPSVKQVIGAGETKASVRFESRGGVRQVDLRVLDDAVYGAALQYFTGSKDHNVALRSLAQRKGLKVSEYGVFKGEKRTAGRTEPDVYAALGLPYIEPELRENRGELEAAPAGSLPQLVTVGDLKCDLHMHTSLSDGTAGFDDMVAACRKRAYTHIAIADHSVSASYAGGLSSDALLRHCDAVDKFNSKSRGFKILKSSEVDIKVEGGMDYPDKVLRRLDFVIGSVHQGFKKDVTRRMCDALAHPLVHAIAHPTGRIIGKRPGYDIDLEPVIECAARYRKILEINAFYGRLDLNDIWARKAAEAGVRIAINTDAHAVADLDWMRYGVLTARRAWLTPQDVINCRSYSGLLGLLAGIRKSAA